jgi:lipopolysaccharide transport system ATP-binding protein
MSSDNFAIRVSHLSKKYKIGGAQEPYSTLRDAIVKSFKMPMEMFHKTPPCEGFWALRDVSFDIEQGEVVGVIGRNGAGKSTLLKILSRITSPTEGTVELHGRVGSLLEVGTGFHPELTGRENIYLSGSILGMKRREINSKLEDIVKFSEIEKFLDTPVKRYSSGMYVRLAFAVAAHLEPEILLIDEVLAVGDATFQKKCLGKMGDVAKEGRTVLFVSHNMNAIKNLCQTAIYVESGRVDMKLPVDEAIAQYGRKNDGGMKNIHYPIQKGEVILHGFLLSQGGVEVSEIDSSYPIEVTIDFEVTTHLTLFRIGIFIQSFYGDTISRSLMADWNPQSENMHKGKYSVKGIIPPNFLASGNFIIQVHVSRFGITDYRFDNEISQIITVHAPKEFNTAHPSEGPFGKILLNAHWVLHQND